MRLRRGAPSTERGMSAKDGLRAWVKARAADPDDAKHASGLIAAFVAEAVREDRKKQDVIAEQRRQATQKIRDVMDRMQEAVNGAKA